MAADTRPVTTVERATDWKVTIGYRMLLRLGWGVFALAIYGAIVALVVGAPGAWWMSAGLALLALLVVALLPEPVPAGMIVERCTHIEAKHPVE